LLQDFIWVKAKIHKNYFAVSKAIAIHAQAVMAQFSDNGNELSHLQDGLEAETISKPVQRVSTVKGLSSLMLRLVENHRSRMQHITVA
jgi:hypothetical protein